MQITRHFSTQDFDFKPWRHLKRVEYPFGKRRLAELCAYLESGLAVTRFRLQYGYRPREFHVEMGGAITESREAHEKGIAVDVVTMEPEKLAGAMVKLPVAVKIRGCYLHLQLC